MSDHHQKNKDSGFGQNYILEEYRRKEKKLMENSCITGEGEDEANDMQTSFTKIRKIITWLTTFSLVLGFIVFLYLVLS